MVERTRLGVLGAVAAVVLAACGETGSVAGPEPEGTAEAAAAVAAHARPLTGAEADYDPLVAMAAGAGFVAIGDQTHGTHEFYRERGRITLRVVRGAGYSAVAVEAEVGPARRVHEYVMGRGSDASAAQALGGFRDFPRWMWANQEVAAFVEALRQYNLSVAGDRRVGFYALDVQEPFGAIEIVESYLSRADPVSAAAAREAYACFAAYEDRLDEYTRAGARGTGPCERGVTQVFDLLEARYEGAGAISGAALDSLFWAYQAARVVMNAEMYFRARAQGPVVAWNVRDQHMEVTAGAVAAHERRKGHSGKVVAWAHNSHVGDARATALGAQGEVNLGSLLRERHGAGNVVLVGMTTYTGSVMAASEWGAAGRTRTLRPALPGSYGDVFHDAALGNFLLLVRGNAAVGAALDTDRLQRAVGVLYLPETERQSHYFTARLAEQFDAVVHFDTTTPVRPL